MPCVAAGMIEALQKEIVKVVPPGFAPALTCGLWMMSNDISLGKLSKVRSASCLHFGSPTWYTDTPRRAVEHKHVRKTSSRIDKVI